MTDTPLVTVLVPMVDEAEDISACLEAVLQQDHPADRLEVIVVDGGSIDDSPAIAKSALVSAGLARWRVLHNPARTTPSSLNVGLAEATGTIVCRVDARTHVQPDHVSRCVERLVADPATVVVGGAQVAVARAPDARARGIARALNNHLAMGGSAYRSGGASGPTETVYLGAFRTTELRDAGGWDERFPTNQDFELNRRLGRQGTVWFDAAIQSGYLPRAELGDLWRQYHRFGRWKVRYWRRTGDRPLARQRLLVALPLVATLAALVLVWRRPAAVLPLAGLGVAGLVAVDEIGGSAPATPAVRGWASAANLAVSTAWVTGVVREAVVGSR